MPIISSYKKNNTPDPSDILIGTDVTNGQTKNFSLGGASIIMINDFLKHSAWKFIVQDPDPDPRPEGTISFENYGGQATPWQDITSLYVNVQMPVTVPIVLPYLQRFIGYDIIIQDVRSLGRFGVYKLTALTQVQGNVYNMELEFVTGNNNIQALQYYSIQIDIVENGDKHAVFEFTQGVPSTLWQIQHNLDKFPSVTTVNTNDVQAFGEVEYIDKNNLNVHFTAGFSGKAFLN